MENQMNSEPEVVARIRHLTETRSVDVPSHWPEFIKAYDAIVAERDAAVQAVEKARDYGHRMDVLAEERAIEAQKLRARLAACERVVEQLRGLRAPSLCCDGENNDEVDAFREGYTSALDDMRDILRAAVAAETRGCTVCGGVIAKIGSTRCEEHTIITGPWSAETQE